MQLTAGAQRLGWMEDGLSEDEETNKQVLIIWVITLIATASVVSGLSVGIKLLSQVGFALGMVLLFLCLVMEKSKRLWPLLLVYRNRMHPWAFLIVLFFGTANYIFNLMVQTTGYCKSYRFARIFTSHTHSLWRIYYY